MFVRLLIICMVCLFVY